jgi:hypothetical protein
VDVEACSILQGLQAALVAGAAAVAVLRAALVSRDKDLQVVELGLAVSLPIVQAVVVAVQVVLAELV